MEKRDYSAARQRLINAYEWCLALGAGTLPERLVNAAGEIVLLDSLDIAVPEEMLGSIRGFKQRWLASRTGPEFRSDWLDRPIDDCRDDARLIGSWYHEIDRYHDYSAPKALRGRS